MALGIIFLIVVGVTLHNAFSMSKKQGFRLLTFYMISFVGFFLYFLQARGDLIERYELQLEERRRGVSENDLPNKTIVLLDIQGLWGGRDLWIDAGGVAYCRVVGRENVSRFYRFELPKALIRGLYSTFEQNEFSELETNKRHGVPDEAYPIIYMKTVASEGAVGKWANDKHKAFDAIYQHLLRIAKACESGTEIDTDGENWLPGTFPTRASIYVFEKLVNGE
jgi:hypothetical protein